MEPRGLQLRWSERAAEISRRLLTEEDTERLLAFILDSAIGLTNAERGYFVQIVGTKPDGGHSFRVVVARGFDGASLRAAIDDVSRTVVRRVLDRGERGLVTTAEEDRDVVDVASVKDRRVLAIICVPLRLRGQPLGVLYLDNRFDPEAFVADDLPVLASFADQAALAIETTEMKARHRQTCEQLQASLAELEALRTAVRAEATAAIPGRPLARYGQLLGASPAMTDLYEQVERASRSWAPVLVQGETGAGKEFVARELHARSDAPSAPFVVVRCADDGPLVESALFGRGGLAPALRAAREGSVFLAHVDRLPRPLQARLATALDAASGERPAAARSFRVVASSCVDMRDLTEGDGFLADLYYRLDVLRINVPPVRRRGGDVPRLLEHFLRQERGVEVPLAPDASEACAAYPWPGNVRELRNEARRIAQAGVPNVRLSDLSPEVRAPRGPTPADSRSLRDVQRDMVVAAVRESKGNKARAARILGIPRATLYGLLERYGIEP